MWNKHFSRLITGSVALLALTVIMMNIVSFLISFIVFLEDIGGVTVSKMAINSIPLIAFAYAVGYELHNLKQYRKSKSDLHFTKDGVPYREPSEILKRPKVKETLNKMKQRGVIK